MKNIFKIKIKLKNFLILLSLLLVIFTLLITSSLLYSNSRNYIEEKMNLINITKMNQAASDIESIFRQIEKIAMYMQNNRQLINYIKTCENENTKVYEKTRINDNISIFLSNIKNSNDNIQSINIISALHTYDHRDYIISSQLLFSLAKRATNGIIFNYPDKLFTSDAFEINDSKVIESLDNKLYFSFSIFDENGVYGNAYIFLKNDFLVKNVNNIDNIALLDSSLRVIYEGSLFETVNIEKIRHTISESASNKPFFSDKEEIYFKKLSYNNWSLLYIVDMNDYISKFNVLIKFVIISFLLSFMASLLFSGYISNRILNPVFTLTNLIKNYKAEESVHSFFDSSKKARLSLREKIFYYFIITVLIPVLIFSVIFYYQSSNIISGQITGAYLAIFNKTADNITDYLNRKHSIMQNIIYDPSLQNYLTDESKVNLDTIYDIFEQNIYLGLDRDYISIYNTIGNLAVSNKFLQKTNMDPLDFEKLNLSSKKMLWHCRKDDLSRSVISLDAPIICITGTSLSKNIGFARMDIDYIYIAELFSELKSDNNNVFLSDSSGNILLGDNQALSGETLNISFLDNAGSQLISTGNQKFLFYYKKLGNSPWYLVSKYNYIDIEKQSSFIFANNIYILIIVLLFVSVLSYYLSISLLKPVNNLNKLFGKFDIGVLDKRVSENYFIDEINDIGSNFNKMVERIENLIDELMVSNSKRNQLEIEKKSAEIIALQAQINPHFLYNTLDTIIYMVKESHIDNAITMIKSLSNLFRYGLSRSEIIITIREEIEYAKSYVNIMNLRFKNRIVFVWNIDEKILDYKTIKLILQPIIENSIYHGINKVESLGIIEITCIDAGESIKFKIKDNGLGMSEDNLKLLIDSLNESVLGNKIGIYNVQSRLRLYFGKKFGLTIWSKQGEGTEVTITIPKIKNGMQRT